MGGGLSNISCFSIRTQLNFWIYVHIFQNVRIQSRTLIWVSACARNRPPIFGRDYYVIGQCQLVQYGGSLRLPAEWRRNKKCRKSQISEESYKRDHKCGREWSAVEYSMDILARQVGVCLYKQYILPVEWKQSISVYILKSTINWRILFQCFLLPYRCQHNNILLTLPSLIN